MAGPSTVDHPQAYIPGDRRQALAAGVEMADRVEGAALFADVSGFTALTEALAAELGAQRGVEELTDAIDRVFHAVIDDIGAFGGHVIYFSGDAVTCWLDGDDGTRAAAAALAVQQTMAAVGTVTTPAGRSVQLGIKVAIAVGPARRFVVGDPAVQLIDVLAGAIVDELAEAEQLADRGEVVLAPSAIHALGGTAEVSSRPRADGSAPAILSALTIEVPRTESPPEPDLDPELVRPWLLPAVHARLEEGRGEFLTELRSAYPFFVRFGGIDFDDDAAPAALDAFVRRAQQVVASFGGKRRAADPRGQGRLPLRRVRLTGQPRRRRVPGRGRRARAASDRVRHRRTRPPDRDRLRARPQWHLRPHAAPHLHVPGRRREPLGPSDVEGPRRRHPRHRGRPPGGGRPLRVRRGGHGRREGPVEPVQVWSLDGLAFAPRVREVRYTLPLVGRDRELAVVADATRAVREGRSRIVAIAAEAGRGKSRLVAEVVRELRAGGMPVAFGEASVIDAHGSYVVWREVVQTLLGIDESDDEAARVRAMRRSLAGIGRQQARRAPLLGPVIGVDVPDNDLTRTFDAKLRKASLESLLLDVVVARARIGPLAVVLEDCHRIDPLSRDLLDVIVRGTEGQPVLFLLDYRPTGRPGGGLGLDGLDRFVELELSELGADAARAAATAKIAQLHGDGVAIAPAFVDAVVARAEATPSTWSRSSTSCTAAASIRRGPSSSPGWISPAAFTRCSSAASTRSTRGRAARRRSRASWVVASPLPCSAVCTPTSDRARRSSVISRWGGRRTCWSPTTVSGWTGCSAT